MTKHDLANLITSALDGIPTDEIACPLELRLRANDQGELDYVAAEFAGCTYYTDHGMLRAAASYWESVGEDDGA